LGEGFRYHNLVEHDETRSCISKTAQATDRVNPMSARQAAESGAQVYAGQILMGSVLKNSKGWNAYSVSGRKIGRYMSAIEAQRAVLAAGAKP
jgi:hypothetical protein